MYTNIYGYTGKCKDIDIDFFFFKEKISAMSVYNLSCPSKPGLPEGADLGPVSFFLSWKIVLSSVFTSKS